MSRVTVEEIEYEHNTANIKGEKNYCRKCDFCFNTDKSLSVSPDFDGDWIEEEINCPKCNTFNILQ